MKQIKLKDTPSTHTFQNLEGGWNDLFVGLKCYTANNYLHTYKKEFITITPNCDTLGEYREQIKRLKEELDKLDKQAKKYFETRDSCY